MNMLVLASVLLLCGTGMRDSWVSEEERDWLRQGKTYGKEGVPEPGSPEGNLKRLYTNPQKTEFLSFNYDEAKSGEYTLEDPLTFEDGSKVETVEAWPARRKELLELFSREVYGRLPPKPEEMVFDLVSEKMSDDRFAMMRIYRQYFRADRSGPVIDWFMAVPRHARGKSPVFLQLNYVGLDKVAVRRSNRFDIPWDMLIANGYAYVSAQYEQITSDTATNAFNGVCELWGRRDPKAKDNPGALIVWAWGLMRGLDLMERIPEIDATRNVVIGSSRLGKAALLAAAYDERFSVCIPNQTGAVGVQLMKRDFGESLKGQHLMFPHWYCRNVWRYEDNPRIQPFDQHLLLSCVAPRGLLLECYRKMWFDPKGEWLAAKAASPVWRFLTGRGLARMEWPQPYDESLVRSPFGYVLRTECHGLSVYDWKWALQFANDFFGQRTSPDLSAAASARNGNACLEDDRPLKQLDLQAKIDAATAGETVRIPTGRWEVKPFCLKSGITLELAEGARVCASTNLADYSSQEGERTFLSATEADDVRICGKGVLDGRGYAFRETAAWRMKGESQPQALPVMMRFTRCRNLKLEDFTYCRGGAWGCHLRNCDGVEIRRVTCFNHVNNTNDGIDIESSNVLIEECNIDADDDAIVLKTESDRDFPVTNVIVRNCWIASDCNAFKFGTGSYCDFKDVTVEDCTFGRPKGNFRFNREKWTGEKNKLTGIAGIAIEVNDGGSLENVTFRNVTIDGYLTPVFVRLERRHEPKSGKTSYLRNVLLENVHSSVADSRLASSITGVPGLRPQNIVLRNCTFVFPGGGTVEDVTRKVPELEKAYPDAHMFKGNLPAWAFYVRHADGVVFDGVKTILLSSDIRKEYVFDDADVKVER